MGEPGTIYELSLKSFILVDWESENLGNFFKKPGWIHNPGYENIWVFLHHLKYILCWNLWMTLSHHLLVRSFVGFVAGVILRWQYPLLPNCAWLCNFGTTQWLSHHVQEKYRFSFIKF